MNEDVIKWVVTTVLFFLFITVVAFLIFYADANQSELETCFDQCVNIRTERCTLTCIENFGRCRQVYNETLKELNVDSKVYK